MDKIVCNEMTYEIDESIVKIEAMEPEQNFNPENLDVNFMPSTEESYPHVTVIMPKRRNNNKNKITRHCNKSQTILPKHDSKPKMIILKRPVDRFRPIRPKPLQAGSSVLRNKLASPVSSVTLSQPTRIVIPSTMPSKEKVLRYPTSSDVSNKLNNSIKSNSSGNDGNIIDDNSIIVSSNTSNSNNSSTVNILSVGDDNKIEKTEKSCTTTNSKKYDSTNSNSNSKNLRTKAISRSYKNGIELFFESMAQTVLNLPKEVQADIKMQICKIVTKAEIQYNCDLKLKS